MRKHHERIRIWLGDRERYALSYLRQFPDFKDKSVSDIFRECLMTIAIDTRLKYEAEKIRQEEEAAKQEEEVDGNDTAE